MRNGSLSDVSGLTAEAGEAEARRLLLEQGRTRFDLAAGGLLKVQLLRLAAERHVLGVTFHHIVYDGWSMEVFARELSALYRAALRGEDAGLPALPVQYADCALWQRAGGGVWDFANVQRVPRSSFAHVPTDTRDGGL